MQNIWKFIVKNASLQEVANSGDRQIRSKIWSRLYYPGELTPRGGTRDFNWRGWSKDFFGFEIFDSRIILGTKIWQVFIWVAWYIWVGIFLGIKKNR